jgi:hypothetical protein
MTIRKSLMIAAAVAITFSGVTQRSFSSPVKVGAAQGVDKAPLDPMEMCPVDTQKIPLKGQQRCGTAGLFDPKSHCCCNPVKNVYKIVPKGGNPNCSNPCKNAGKKGPN